MVNTLLSNNTTEITQEEVDNYSPEDNVPEEDDNIFEENDIYYQVQDDEIRIDFFNDNTNTSYKRYVCKESHGYETLLEIITDNGYIPSDEQNTMLKATIDYVSKKNGIRGIDIKRGKGKQI